MTLSLTLSDEDAKLIENYAQINNISIAELFHRSVMARIEDEFDLAAYNRAMTEFKSDPHTYTLEEVERELGL